MIFGYRTRRLRYSLILGILTLFVIFVGRDGGLDWAGYQLKNNQPGLYRVKYFVDGDTVIVNMDSHDETIRLIGADTPEIHKPNTPVQCYGPEAAAYTKERLSTMQFHLISDPLSTNRDRYGRLLRYIYLTDGTNFEHELIAKGYAFYYPYFPFTKSDDFNTAQQHAMKSNLGLWGKCLPKPTNSGGYISNPL